MSPTVGLVGVTAFTVVAPRTVTAADEDADCTLSIVGSFAPAASDEVVTVAVFV